MISAKINLSAIEKKRIFTNKEGKHSMDILLIDTPNNKYGDYMIVQQISKEERDAGVKAPILGNGKILAKSGSSSAPQQQVPPASGFGTQTEDSLPF